MPSVGQQQWEESSSCQARAGLGWSWVGCLSGAYEIGDDNSRCIQGDYESPAGADLVWGTLHGR